MPHPGYSVLKKIIDQIVIELKKIKTANGYLTDINDEAITLFPSQWKALNIYPKVCVVYGDGMEELKGPRHVRRKKHIRLMFYLRSDINNPTPYQIGNLEVDLAYLFSENRTLQDSNGDDLCVILKVSSDRTSVGTFDPFEIWLVDLEVVYHEQW